MLPVHTRASGAGASGAPREALIHTLAWGSLAECLTSVCCPRVLWRNVNVTSTALNVVGALAAGAAQAIDDVQGDPLLRRHCACFQAGFVTVVTSYSFVTEQAARLAAAPEWGLYSACVYVMSSLATSCTAFAVGRVACAALLDASGKRARTRLREWTAPPPAAVLRGLLGVVALVWVWVALSPAGSVFEPLEIDEVAAAEEDAPGATSKAADVAHLACGLVLQAAGLLAGVGIAAGSGEADARGGAVEWRPLRCNLCACGLLLLLRGAEAAGLASADGLLAIKLRDSGCGALSSSGGLAALLFTTWRDRGRPRRASFNFALHASLAAATGYALHLTDRAFGMTGLVRI